jgi:leader peptidase (prepilin peptidase)/N-methyltransferase
MEPVFHSTPLLLTGVFVLGALVGSFLNVVILRTPALLEHDWRCQCKDLLELDQDEAERPPGLVAGRSMCPHCGHTIRAWENIPLLSYFVLLRGHCSNCQARISLRYPAVELTTAVLFLVTIWHFGPNLQGLTALVLTSFLIALTGIDIDEQLLPDNLTLPLLWGGILLGFWSVHVDLASSAAGAIAGYLSLWIVYHVFRLLTGKEGMGYGDFKLLAALGAWMGWQMLPLIILLSSIVGAVTGLALLGTGKLEREKPMPFGPFIATAGWIALIWGDQIVEIYMRSGAFG